MAKFIDMTNMRFDRLFVIHRMPRTTRNGDVKWKVLCDCGVEKIVYGNTLRRGQTKSCGCLQRELTSKRSKLPYSSTKEYKAWHAMKTRCKNPKRKDADRYKNRGITVCDRWINSFPDFLLDVGFAPSPKHTLDRIDNDGNYEPGNIRWATMKEQCNNRSNSRKYRRNLSKSERIQLIKKLCLETPNDPNIIKLILQLTR